MREYEIGTRIYAVLSAENKTVKALGAGTYLGDFVPPEELGSFAALFGRPNPKLQLDSGKVAWGCECWWGPEEAMLARIEQYKKQGYTVVDVDIEAERAKTKRTPAVPSL